MINIMLGHQRYLISTSFHTFHFFTIKDELCLVVRKSVRIWGASEVTSDWWSLKTFSGSGSGPTISPGATLELAIIHNTVTITSMSHSNWKHSLLSFNFWNYTKYKKMKTIQIAFLFCIISSPFHFYIIAVIN